MDNTQPRQGGISLFLQLVAGFLVLCAFIGGALVNLSLGAEIAVMISTMTFASLLWATAVVVQELRNIEFNTRKAAKESINNVEPAQSTNADDLDEVTAFQAYGIKREGDKYRFGEYLYDNLCDAVDYARRVTDADF